MNHKTVQQIKNRRAILIKVQQDHVLRAQTFTGRTSGGQVIARKVTGALYDMDGPLMGLQHHLRGLAQGGIAINDIYRFWKSYDGHVWPLRMTLHRRGGVKKIDAHQFRAIEQFKATQIARL